MVALLGSANLVGIGAFAGGAGRDGQQQNHANHGFQNFCPYANKLEYADVAFGSVASPGHYMIRCEHDELESSA